jgi:hypothetical protein
MGIRSQGEASAPKAEKQQILVPAMSWMLRLDRKSSTGPERHTAALFPSRIALLLAFLSVASGLILDTVSRGRRDLRLLAYLAAQGAPDRGTEGT